MCQSAVQSSFEWVNIPELRAIRASPSASSAVISVTLSSADAPVRKTPMLSALGMAVVIQNAVMLVGGRRPLIYPSFLPRGIIDVAGAIVSCKQ
jgi:branched-subunit amino acid ABC-type transport system permease component